MSKYATVVFVICVLVGMLEKISFGGRRDISRIALSVITLYVVIAPLVSAAKSLDFTELFDPDRYESAEIDEGYTAVAEDAFARGIGRAVEVKFSLEEGSVDVKVIGFDFEKMRAESIKIILSGRSVVADYRGIEKYVNSMEIGKCEVVIEIG